MASRRSSGKGGSGRRQTAAAAAAAFPQAEAMPAADIRSRRSARLALAVMVALYLVLAGAYNAVTPAATADQHNPDENAHVLYVQTIASGHLPVFHAGGADYEAHQPPLYYLLCAPVYRAAISLGDADAVHAVRWVSTLFGALLIVVTFLTVETLFPAEPWLVLSAALFVAFLPMNVAQNASVTNDTLTDLVIAVDLWMLALLAMTPPEDRRLQTRRSILLGLALGLGIWTKTSTLLAFPTVAAACYLMARQPLIEPKHAAKLAGIALGFGGVAGLPWLIRNQMLYGDPVAQHIFVSAFQNTALAPDVARFVFGGSMGGYLFGVARWTFASFWGVFDSMRLFWGQDPAGRTPSPAGPLPPIYDFLFVISLAAVVGVFVCFRRCRLTLPPRTRVLLSSFIVLIVLTALAHLRFVLTFFQAQGRYWYPALVPLATFFVLGWRGYFPGARAFAVFVALLAGGLLGLNVYTLFGLLVPRFSGQ